MGDDGIGINAIRKLKKFNLPDNISLIEGATFGLDLLYFLENKTHAIFIDAIDLNKTPGELIIVEKEEIFNYYSMKFSPHEIGINDLLFAADLINVLPENFILIGLQPYIIELSLNLSDLIKKNMKVLINEILKILKNWGINLDA